MNGKSKEKEHNTKVQMRPRFDIPIFISTGITHKSHTSGASYTTISKGILPPPAELNLRTYVYSGVPGIYFYRLYLVRVIRIMYHMNQHLIIVDLGTRIPQVHIALIGTVGSLYIITSI